MTYYPKRMVLTHEEATDAVYKAQEVIQNLAIERYEKLSEAGKKKTVQEIISKVMLAETSPLVEKLKKGENLNTVARNIINLKYEIMKATDQYPQKHKERDYIISAATAFTGAYRFHLEIKKPEFSNIIKMVTKREILKSKRATHEIAKINIDGISPDDARKLFDKHKVALTWTDFYSKGSADNKTLTDALLLASNGVNGNNHIFKNAGAIISNAMQKISSSSPKDFSRNAKRVQMAGEAKYRVILKEDEVNKMVLADMVLGDFASLALDMAKLSKTHVNEDFISKYNPYLMLDSNKEKSHSRSRG